MSHENLDLATLLRSQGYRMTAQRQMVLDAVCRINGHASPEQVYELVQQVAPAVDRATVYRTLKLLRDLDLIVGSVSAEGQMSYEMAATRPHHHLVCRHCGADIECSDEHFDHLAQVLQEQHGFEIDARHVTLTGLCAGCREIG